MARPMRPWQCITVGGRYALRARRPNGEIYAAQRGSNIVVLAGENLVVNRVDPDGVAAGPDWMALGDSDQPILVTDTALGNEHAAAWAKIQSTDNGTPSGSQIGWTFNFTAATALEIKEMGVFNAAAPSTGTMFSRFLIQTIDIGIADVLDVTWTLTFQGVE